MNSNYVIYLYLAAGHSIQRGDIAERDPVSNQERTLHPSDGRLSRYPYLPILHRRIYILPR